MLTVSGTSPLFGILRESPLCEPGLIHFLTMPSEFWKPLSKSTKSNLPRLEMVYKSQSAHNIIKSLSFFKVHSMDYRLHLFPFLF